jgi:hypothetical protein
MAANIHSPGDLLEVRASGSGKPRRLRILGEERLPQRSKSSRSCCFILGVCTWVCGNFEVIGGYDVVGSPAAVGGFEGGEGFDLQVC